MHRDMKRQRRQHNNLRYRGVRRGRWLADDTGREHNFAIVIDIGWVCAIICFAVTAKQPDLNLAARLLMELEILLNGTA